MTEKLGTCYGWQHPHAKADTCVNFRELPAEPVGTPPKCPTCNNEPDIFRQMKCRDSWHDEPAAPAQPEPPEDDYDLSGGFGGPIAPGPYSGERAPDPDLRRLLRKQQESQKLGDDPEPDWAERAADDTFVARVEDELGMGAGAWDMIDPTKICAAVLKVGAALMREEWSKRGMNRNKRICCPTCGRAKCYVCAKRRKCCFCNERTWRRG